MSDHIPHTRKKPAGEAVQHWRWQRGTAIIMVFLASWFVVTLVSKLQSADPAAIAHWLGKPWVAIAMAALVLVAFVHKHIGIHEILTDYVHAPCKMKLFNVVLNLATAALGLATLAAIWHLHIVGAA